MKLAIMQPYLFPYIGYFQLINAVDKFIILDDVNYINRGWINRNRILVNEKDYLFTVPIKKASQNKLILQCELTDELWQDKFLKTIQMSYKKAPLFSNVFPLIENIVRYQEKNLSKFIVNQIMEICSLMQIKTSLVPSSSIYNTSDLKAQDKIIAICKAEQAKHYINPIGGIGLYKNDVFLENEIKLSFLKTHKIAYKQNFSGFMANLSIIDLLMFNSADEVKHILNKFDLIEN